MTKVTRNQIISDLQSAGIPSGDVLLVHSSLKSIGQVDGGAWSVIEALVEVTNPNCTLVMPTFSYSFLRDGDHIENPPYHPLRTPSQVGLITEFFRFYPGTIRSKHPTHSVAALGPAAEQIIAGHRPTDSPFSRNSPFGRLCEYDTEIMFLGCGVGTNSTLHAVEDWLDLPYMLDCRARAILVDEHNNMRTVEFSKEPRGHRSFYIPDSDFRKRLLAKDVFRMVKVGQATVYLAKMKKMIRSVLEILEDEPSAMLCSESTCEFCRTGRERIEEYRAEITNRIVDELNRFEEL